MKNFTAAAVILCIASVASGQQSNASAGGLSRRAIGAKGNPIHHFFGPRRSAISGPAGRRARLSRLRLQFRRTAFPQDARLANLVYGSGPVMRNPTNYLIFWQPAGGFAPAFPAGYQAGVEKFFPNVGGTPFYNIVTQYGDSTGVPVPNSASLGAPSWTDTATAAPSGCDGTSTGDVGGTPHCPLTDGDIQNEVTAALAANPKWIRPGNNVEYFCVYAIRVGECTSKETPRRIRDYMSASTSTRESAPPLKTRYSAHTIPTSTGITDLLLPAFCIGRYPLWKQALCTRISKRTDARSRDLAQPRTK